ncbi:phospho-sugar mutase [Micrococcus terreus]|uniref:phospho-sugar mutase n=1 Tax=Micrococcus terreus TaxID=574650 RepID=UPI003D709E65
MTTTPAPPSELPDDGLLLLLEQAQAWARQDPDEADRTTLEAEIAAARAGDATASRTLASRFSGPLAFGTAGLRAAEGPGPARMNRVVVRRTAAGLARYLLDQVPSADGAPRPRVVVGYDARRGSRGFALDSAAVFTAAGLETILLPGPLPTPVLAFAVRHLEAEAGVMVTASHNPPEDNGYKVYLGGRATDEHGRGAQIVAPADREIAARIDHEATVDSIPLAAEGWSVAGDELLEAYRQAALGVLDPEHTAHRDLRIVYTPLHGVGGAVFPDLLQLAGFPAPTVVTEQAEPDPAFPTVTFPNPEEPGAMDLALATAEREGADLVIAHDPDADRCALAVQERDGSWRMLRGDETGVLLGHHLMQRLQQSGAAAANSVVSSRQLSRMAQAAGVEHQTTLTGFKWISRVPGLGFGYEEALGYCVDPANVRDKDGMTAALVAAELAATLKSQGRSLLDLLDSLAVQHGLYATGQLSIRVADLSLLDAMMSRLRQAPPSSLGGQRVIESADLAEGHRGLPPTDGVLYLTEGDSRVIIRPSGTEPKLKCYLETVLPVEDASRVAEARVQAQQVLDRVTADVDLALGR